MGFNPRGRGGPPTWLVFIIGIAFVFGVYYLWQGAQAFLSTGLSVLESTEQAIEQVTSTAVRFIEIQTNAPTPLPTFTPVPPCLDFVVDVPSGIMRELPTTNSNIVEALDEGEVVCVIQREGDTEWYLIDRNPRTNRVDSAYMRDDIIRALNPTLTPSKTFTPAPTVTPTTTLTPSDTPNPTLTSTHDPRITNTPIPTLTPTETPANINI